MPRVYGSTVAHIKRSKKGEAHTADQIYVETTEAVPEVPATAAAIVGSGATDTDFSGEGDDASFSLTVDETTEAIVLDAAYADAAAVVAAINTQFGSEVATQDTGVITITSPTTGEDSTVVIASLTEGAANTGLADAVVEGDAAVPEVPAQVVSVADVIQELRDAIDALA